MDYSNVRQELKLMSHFLLRSNYMGTRDYVDQLEDIADFFFPQEITNVPHVFRCVPSVLAPDCCGNCRAFFGTIRFGRITECCHLCKDSKSNRVNDSYYINR